MSIISKMLRKFKRRNEEISPIPFPVRDKQALNDLSAAIRAYAEDNPGITCTYEEMFEVINDYKGDGCWTPAGYIVESTSKRDENGNLEYGDDQFVILRFTNRRGEVD